MSGIPRFTSLVTTCFTYATTATSAVLCQASVLLLLPILYTHTHTHTHTNTTYICIHVYMYTYIQEHTCGYMGCGGAYACGCGGYACGYAGACISIHQHTSAYVSIGAAAHTPAAAERMPAGMREAAAAAGGMRLPALGGGNLAVVPFAVGRGGQGEGYTREGGEGR